MYRNRFGKLLQSLLVKILSRLIGIRLDPVELDRAEIGLFQDRLLEITQKRTQSTAETLGLCHEITLSF